MADRLEPFSGVYEVKQGNFAHNSGKYAKGSKYGPLLTDHFSYLCPDCGGWGEIGSRLGPASDRAQCDFCAGKGEIPLDDLRVVEDPQPLRDQGLLRKALNRIRGYFKLSLSRKPP